MDVLTEGYALPVTGGFYPKPPYLYRGAKAIIALYEADPARIAELLPAGLTPLEDPPVCIAWVVHYPFSTLGVYNETIMLIRVSFEKEQMTTQQDYLQRTRQFVDHDVPPVINGYWERAEFPWPQT